MTKIVLPEDPHKIKSISVKNWDYTCGDGCCYDWGVYVTITTQNGVQYKYETPDLETAIEQHFGLEIDYIYEDNCE